LCTGPHEVNVPGTFRTKRVSIHRPIPLNRDLPGTLTGTHRPHKNLGHTLP
jgi:hypothetical protein